MSDHSLTDGLRPGRSQLSTEGWLRLRELFLLATESSPPSRKDFLDRHCADAPEVRAELAALLEADDHGTRDWLKEPLVANDAFRNAESGFQETEDWIPERVGPYILQEKIGGGGMGSVWLAQLDAPFERRVAIKFPQENFQSEEGIERFLQEMQILASLDHPGITRVLDAGRTSRGGPWFAMEQVDGVDIEESCDSARLSIARRLALFVEVCDAVHHAHQRGIVHLDIKPANVLVEEQAGRPRPRLIDFGIARLNRVPGSTGHTDRAAGTLVYMSPEQATGDGARVDIRSDVYSLGVLLRTLLTGSQSCLHSPSEQALKGSSAVGAARGCTNSTLSRRLVGDLDWITNKACQAEPNERYDSVSSLASDVRMHLADESLPGLRTPFSTRLRKSLRRCRAVWLASGIALLGLGAGGLGLLRAWWSTAQLHQAEVVLRSQAQVEVERATRAKEFLASTLALADPRVTLSPDLSARALLDDASSRVKAAFVGDPLGEASIRQAIGDAYRSLGAFDEAAAHLRETIRLLEEGGEWHSLEMYDALWSLVFIHDETSFRRGLEYGRRAVEIRYLVLKEMSPPLASAVSELLMLGDLPQSEIDEHIEELLELVEQLPPEHAAGRRVTAEAIADLGFFLGTLSSDLRAMPMLDTASDLLGEGIPPTHPDRTRLVGWKVQLLLDKQQWGAAAQLMETLIDSYRGVLAHDHWRRHEAESRLGFARAMGALQESGASSTTDLAEQARVMLASTEALARLRGNDSHSSLEARARLIDFLAESDDLGFPALEAQHELLLGALRDSDQFAVSWRVLRSALLPLEAGDDALDQPLLGLDRFPGGFAIALPDSFLSLCERIESAGGLEPPMDRLLAEFLLYAVRDQPHPDPRMAVPVLDCALRLWGDPEQSPLLLGADLYAIRASNHHEQGQWEAAISDGQIAQELFNSAGAAQTHSALLCTARLAQSLSSAGSPDEARAMLAPALQLSKQLFGAESWFAEALAIDLQAIAELAK